MQFTHLKKKNVLLSLFVWDEAMCVRFKDVWVPEIEFKLVGVVAGSFLPLSYGNGLILIDFFLDTYFYLFFLTFK